MKGVSIKLALASNSNARYHSLFSMYEICISLVPFPSLKTLNLSHLGDEAQGEKSYVYKCEEKLCFGLYIPLLLNLVLKTVTVKNINILGKQSSEVRETIDNLCLCHLSMLKQLAQS